MSPANAGIASWALMQAKARKAARARRVEMFFIGNFLAKDCVVTNRMK
jgi:hypothetical protein